LFLQVIFTDTERRLDPGQIGDDVGVEPFDFLVEVHHHRIGPHTVFDYSVALDNQVIVFDDELRSITIFGSGKDIVGNQIPFAFLSHKILHVLDNPELGFGLNQGFLEFYRILQVQSGFGYDIGYFVVFLESFGILFYIAEFTVMIWSRS
jgi:hypothetical protein